MRPLRHLAVACIGALACSDVPFGPSASDFFPREMRLIAEAEGEVAGLYISCFVDWNVDVDPSGSDLYGTAGGEAYREVLDDAGGGIEFWARPIRRPCSASPRMVR